MNREQYLTYRNRNDIVSILYRHFILNAVLRLRVQDFVNFFNIWKGNKIAVKDTLNYYDTKFEIIILESKEGKQLKFY